MSMELTRAEECLSYYIYHQYMCIYARSEEALGMTDTGSRKICVLRTEPWRGEDGESSRYGPDSLIFPVYASKPLKALNEKVSICSNNEGLYTVTVYQIGPDKTVDPVTFQGITGETRVSEIRIAWMKETGQDESCLSFWFGKRPVGRGATIASVVAANQPELSTFLQMGVFISED